MKGKALTASPRYRSFVTARDQTLESILSKYLNSADFILSALLRRTQEIVSFHHARGAIDVRLSPRIQAEIEQAFQGAEQDLVYLFHRMRITVYTLATAGETEAIGRALGKTQRAHLAKPVIQDQLRQETPSGGTITARVNLALHRLRANVIGAIKMGAMHGEAAKDIQARIAKAFPKTKRVSLPRVLRRPKPVREAARDPMNPVYQLFPGQSVADTSPDETAEETVTMTTGVIDSQAWQTVLEDYQSDMIPGPRGPFDKMVTFDIGTEGDVTFRERYEWELEQEMTQDFVQNVRDGQVDAANENGIEDFQWIAVIDSHTDLCCSVRDGLSSSEIESGLSNGDIDGDECDSIVPPAHFNCRCTLAPISQDLPDVAPPDFGSFDDWLEGKAAA